MPVVTLVSGTFNRLLHLRDMIFSARAAVPKGFPLDFVIIDGGSTDGTQAWCKAQPDITLIEHGELKGAINAFTEGAHKATGKYVIMSNDDVTFAPDSIIRAVVYLENTLTCGAVAFADNRAANAQQGRGGSQYAVAMAWAQRNGQGVGVPYVQVGLVRKWIGDQVNWWRGHDERFLSARTYGGDNMLSSNIWALGYTIDRVEGAQVTDKVLEDGLRQLNGAKGEADSRAYYTVYPNGPTIPDKPQVANPDKRLLRILYFPIYENHEVQRQQKRGLRDALMTRGLVYEVDFMGLPRERLEEILLRTIGLFAPDMILTQLHGPDVITPELLNKMRQSAPRAVVVNWNGDAHRHGLTTPEMIRLLRLVDLQLVVNDSVLPIYASENIPAAYWQIGAERPALPLPEVPKFDVVFLASAYNDNRLAIGTLLRDKLGDKVGLYGDYWPKSEGNCTYDFAKGEALYQNAKIGIGSNEFPNERCFVSNRVIQALAAGGALFLQQHVPGLEEATGIAVGKHYVEWTDVDELSVLLDYWLDPKHATARRKIAKAGRDYVLKNHTFDARVDELFGTLLNVASRKPRYVASLKYTGQRLSQFGLMNGKYLCNPGKVLTLDPLDAESLLAAQPDLWERVETAESEALVR